MRFRKIKIRVHFKGEIRYAKEGCSSLETKVMIKVCSKGKAGYSEEGCNSRKESSVLYSGHEKRL